MYVQGNREIVKIIDNYKKSMEEHVATITALEEEKVKLSKVMIFRYLFYVIAWSIFDGPKL